MAWGLAEQDAEKRGYKAGVTDGIEQGIAQGIERGIAQGIEQGMEQGIAQGMEQKAFETAQNLLAMDLSLDNIAKATGLSLETLEKLAAEISPSNK